MSKFTGTLDDYRKLRARLKELYNDGSGETSGRLLTNLVACFPSAKEHIPHYSTIDKFRKEETQKFQNDDVARYIWDYVFRDEAISPSFKTRDEHDFYYSFAAFFDINKHREDRALRYWPGRYTIHHYSELFNNYSPSIPCAILIGQLDINVSSDPSVLTVQEQQSYDGHLGLNESNATYKGYLFSKGPQFYMVLQESPRETPKFYVIFKVQYEGKTISWMRGYMMKGSYDDGHGYFHSPVYITRSKNDAPVTCNILQISEISHNIIEELNRDRRIINAEGRT